MTDTEKAGTKTLWAMLFLIQVLVIAFGLIVFALNTFSTPQVQPTFTADSKLCTSEEKKYSTEGKNAAPSLVSHCAFLEKYVMVLEGVQVQLMTWLERGLILFVALNLGFILIEMLILKRRKTGD